MNEPSSAAPAPVVPVSRAATDAGAVVISDAAPELPGDPTWRRSFVAALIVWASARAAYAILTVLSGQLSPSWGPLWQAWLQWDGWHYVVIANSGYDAAPQDIAFFPLFPLLMRATDVVLPGGLLEAALLISNISAYGAMVLLHRLVATEFGLRVADRTVYFLAVFPTAYFLAAPYNHSLFLLLAIGCLYLIRRESWWLAGSLGALASATRSVGVLLILPFAFEYLRRREFKVRRIRFDGAAVALVPAGLAAFSVFSWRTRADALAFSNAQTFWGKDLAWPGETIWLALGQLGKRPVAENYDLIGDLAGTVLGLALLIACVVGPWALRRDQWYLVAFAAPVLLLPLFFPLAQENPLSSSARYLLDVSVLFVILARAGRQVWVERGFVVVALALQFGYLLMYLRGVWTF